MKHEIAALTDTGRARKNNEDALVFNVETGVCVLADGMGGYNAGEVASQMAVQCIGDALDHWMVEARGQARAPEVGQAMEVAVDQANRKIYEAANSTEAYFGMGTTLVVAVLHQDWMVVGHIGDSRAYLLRGGVFQQITRDHSLLQEQLDAGLISPEQARHATHKNLVTRALGVEPLVQLEWHIHPLQAGDLLLLCSDGLSDMVSESAMAELLQSSPDLQEQASLLVQRANAQGGRDNITVVLASVADPRARRSLLARWLRR